MRSTRTLNALTGRQIVTYLL